MAPRSALFSPGDRPEMMRKAPTTDADAVVFDLEDAVAPNRKSAARGTVNDVLSDPAFDPDAEVCVRINPGDAGVTDLDAVLDGNVRLDAVVVPKASAAADIKRVADRLAEAGRPRRVWAIVETAAGILGAEDVARADGTAVLAFGAEDLTADLGATRTPEMTEMLYARERVVVAGRAAGVDLLDTPFPDYEDAEGLAEETSFARSLGFDGKLAIHPSQVAVINEAFTPDSERVEWAERVLDARDEAETTDRGAFSVDGQMIDSPLIAQAERILERAPSSRE